MNSRHLTKIAASSVAALATAATIAQSSAALAQAPSTPPAPPGQTPAPTATAPVSAPDQAAAQSYPDQYARWVAQNCIDQRTGNTAAGAVVGGALGAMVGATLTGGHSSGALLAGGAVGAFTGAAVGSSEATSCPPGYGVRAGAPVFVYAGPAYDPGPPPWYQPWVWVGDRWIYEPYRYAYWFGPAYPPGRWASRPWPVHHRL